jgi:hypothetical protein
MYAPSPADQQQDGARRRERGDVRTISGARTIHKTAHDAGSVAMYAPSPARGPVTRRRTTQGAWRCTHHLRRADQQQDGARRRERGDVRTISGARTSNKTAHDAGSVAMYAPSPADHPQDGARRRERGDVRTISGARTSNKTAHDAGSVAMYAPSPADQQQDGARRRERGDVRTISGARTDHPQDGARRRERGDVRTVSGARTIDRKRDVGGAAVVVGKGESFTHFYLSCIPIRRSESL